MRFSLSSCICMQTFILFFSFSFLLKNIFHMCLLTHKKQKSPSSTPPHIVFYEHKHFSTFPGSSSWLSKSCNVFHIKWDFFFIFLEVMMLKRNKRFFFFFFFLYRIHRHMVTYLYNIFFWYNDFFMINLMEKVFGKFSKQFLKLRTCQKLKLSLLLLLLVVMMLNTFEFIHAKISNTKCTSW